MSRLLDKAEQAADQNNLDQAETYRILAGQVAYGQVAPQWSHGCIVFTARWVDRGRE
ncbi:hypothetical protein ABIQ69_11465 [Agromyces sp. G08B096]|uniref:Uncharacterized protein n=1 Tax=Agromyces sp. G08B096 TaxID=3156399 RepID=A0AAU7W467_9MICO